MSTITLYTGDQLCWQTGAHNAAMIAPARPKMPLRPTVASVPAPLACEDEAEGADADAEPVAEPLDDGDVAVDEAAADTALAVGTLVAFVHWRLDVAGAVTFDDSVRSAHCSWLPVSECSAR